MTSRAKIAAALLACAALLLGASGLRVSRNDSVVGRPPYADMYMPDLESEVEGVLSIGEYRDIWTKRYEMETHTAEPLTSKIQLILGVFSVPEEVEYRQVMRETWMQQEGVCFWSNTSQANCTVYSAFVVGKLSANGRHAVNSSEMAIIQSEDGILLLNATENMNNGKSFLWFATALQMFPWATHIGKMDSDTYPFIHKLIYRMSLSLPCTKETKGGPYEFIGRPGRVSRSDKQNASFSRSCSSKCATQFTGREDVTPLGHNFTFMSGQLYMLSLPLVEKISWDVHKKGFEDRMISAIVQNTAEEQKFCVMIKRPDAWYHRNSWMDAVYANNFTDGE